MGKGDIKTKRGKISKGTFGVSRPHKGKLTAVAVQKPKTEKKKPTTKKPTAKKTTTKKKAKTKE